MADHDESGVGRRFLVMLVYVVIGAPIVAYLWETLNDILSGYIDEQRVLISIPLTVVLILLLSLLARQILHWENPQPRRP